MKDFNNIAPAREKFKLLLEQLENQQYFKLLAAMKELPGVIDGQAFGQALAQIESTGQTKAIADFKLYGQRWNVMM